MCIGRENRYFFFCYCKVTIVNVRYEVLMVVPVMIIDFQDVMCCKDLYAFGISVPSV